MLSGWPIRTKLKVEVALLVFAVATLAFAGFHNVYSFRGLVRSISRRAGELPIAVDLAAHISTLQSSVPQRPTHSVSDPFGFIASERFDSFAFEHALDQIPATLDSYREVLKANEATPNAYIGDIRRELETVQKLEAELSKIQSLRSPQNTWPTDDETCGMLENAVATMNHLAEPLPRYLLERMRALQGEVRGYYRTWIVVTWLTSLFACGLLMLLIHLFYRWVFQPLRQLINGSRLIANGGDFGHRIHLDSGDEMEELAMAMNDMTGRFEQVRDDLDRQVQERTKEVIRGEQLASVGFLAAGVAHEINNPLASIALCAESLEQRIGELMPVSHDNDEHEVEPYVADNQTDEGEYEVIADYLRMIQQEAFRCKEITEKLLDFSRLGDVERHETELVDLVEGVVEMVQHVGKYKQKEIRFLPQEPVYVLVNPQEIKQVVLNLITNGLESLEPGGTVTIKLYSREDEVTLEVSDNGCGMTEEVRAHLFEPFFTRRRDGQGTGLGMSISYRIISEHGGEIDVASAGLRMGSTITVRFPLTPNTKENHHRNRAA